MPIEFVGDVNELAEEAKTASRFFLPSSARWQKFGAGEDEKSTEDQQDPPEGVMSALPSTMKAARNARAPKMPENSTRCWYFSGIDIVANNIDQTKTLSILSDFSIR